MITLEKGTWYWVTKKRNTRLGPAFNECIEAKALCLDNYNNDDDRSDEVWAFLTRAGRQIFRGLCDVREVATWLMGKETLVVLNDALDEMGYRRSDLDMDGNVELVIPVDTALKYVNLLKQAYQAERSK